MNIILFDDPFLRIHLLPFTYTRPVACLRVGILRIFEKWELISGSSISILTEEYLHGKFGPPRYTPDNYYIDGSICPTRELVSAIRNLKKGQSLWHQGTLAAFRSEDEAAFAKIAPPPGDSVQFYGEMSRIDRIWKIFQQNGEQIRRDYELITAGRQGEVIKDPYTRVYAGEGVFVEEGAHIKSAILNAEKGPVYIGKGAEVMEGAMIRGPFAMGEYSVVSMGAKIRGDTTLGPHCKVGGEVSNAVFFGNSNKGHDGYLGNAVVGEWCNLGAGTNASNLKNNYTSVKLWSYLKEEFEDSGLQFCGLMMGDHSKCGISTMFNTGTVVGVCANIYGSDFPPGFIPSFAWGGAKGFSTYRPGQALATVERVLERRGRRLEEADREILMEIFKRSAKFRAWEKQI